MKNKKWSLFNKLTGKCYDNLIGAEPDNGCWQQAFELLMEIVREERAEDPQFALELEALDEETDYEYDIQGWLEDCLDEVEMRKNYSTLLKMCDDLLTTFSWPENTGGDIKFRKASGLAALGQKKKSAEFCKAWLRENPDDIVAATASVYAFIEVKEFEKAKGLVDRYISENTECSEENDIMFVAASILYQVMGKNKEKKKIDKAIKEYENYLKDFFDSPEFDDEDDTFWDDELPFM